MGTVGECGCQSQVALGQPACFCPGSEIARLIGRRYFLPLLAAIGNAARIRFGELRKDLRIASSTLALRLAELEAAELARREVYAEVPPRVEYSLTAAGEALRERLRTVLATRLPGARHG